jgi:hypothetical protein
MAGWLDFALRNRISAHCGLVPPRPFALGSAARWTWIIDLHKLDRGAFLLRLNLAVLLFERLLADAADLEMETVIATAFAERLV